MHPYSLCVCMRGLVRGFTGSQVRTMAAMCSAKDEEYAVSSCPDHVKATCYTHNVYIGKCQMWLDFNTKINDVIKGLPL